MSWCIDNETYEILPSGQPPLLDALFNETSLPITLPPQPTASSAGLPVTLQRSESRVLEAVATATKAEPGAAPASHGPTTPLLSSRACQPAKQITDAIFYTGGVVWSCEFAPWAAGTSLSDLNWSTGLNSSAAFGFGRLEVLAVSVHPKEHNHNRAGVTQHDVGAVQLWGVPSLTLTPGCAGGGPWLLAHLVHNGTVTWDVKWCPEPQRLLPGSSTAMTPAMSADASNSSNSTKLQGCCGILAMVLGDGTVQIASVPDVVSLASHPAGCGGSGSQQPLALRLKPVVTLTREMLGGSIPSTCEWGLRGPHSQLLVGGWDGMVSLWRLPTGPDRLQAVFQARCDKLPIRRMLWEPLGKGRSVDGFEACRFATASQSGHLAIWDTRDMLVPLSDKLLTRSPLLDAVWTTRPSSLLAVLEDGTVRQTVMEPVHYSFGQDALQLVMEGDGTSPMWSCHHCPGVGAIALGGADGLVALMCHEALIDLRHRKPFAPVGGVVSDGQGGLLVIRAGDAAGAACLFSGGVAYHAPGAKSMALSAKRRRKSTAAELVAKDAAAVSFPDESQTLFTVRFSPNSVGVAWLASGGAAGLVRIQRVAVGVEK